MVNLVVFPSHVSFWICLYKPEKLYMAFDIYIDTFQTNFYISIGYPNVAA